MNRFWDKVDKNGNNGCWNWVAYHNSDGYGKLSINGKSEFAHRISWVLHFGDIPHGLCVCHHCDNPRCVNPDHLFLASHTENMKDMKIKGRTSLCKNFGEKNGNSKLTSENVESIRRLASSSENHYGLMKSICETYNISKATLYRVISYKTWKLPI